MVVKYLFFKFATIAHWIRNGWEFPQYGWGYLQNNFIQTLLTYVLKVQTGYIKVHITLPTEPAKRIMFCKVTSHKLECGSANI